MPPRDSGLGEMAQLLQLLPMLGGDMKDIAGLAQIGIAADTQKDNNDYRNERNRLYQASINQRAMTAEQIERRRLAELALKQEAEARMRNTAGFNQQRDISRLGFDMNNAAVRNSYTKQLMEASGIRSQGELMDQQLLQGLMPELFQGGGMPGMGQPPQGQPDPTGGVQLSPEEREFILQLQQQMQGQQPQQPQR